jgi:hypothetical protein
MVLTRASCNRAVAALFLRFTFLWVQCLACCVASSPCHSLPTSLLSSLLPELARARTRQSCDANARFSRLFFLNEDLNAAAFKAYHIQKKATNRDSTWQKVRKREPKTEFAESDSSMTLIRVTLSVWNFREFFSVLSFVFASWAYLCIYIQFI